jgi:hypothetical protein
VVAQLKDLGARAAEAAGAAKEAAVGAARQARRKAADAASALVENVGGEAGRLLEEQKGLAALEVARYGKIVRQSGRTLNAVGLGRYAESAAGLLDGLAGYLDNRRATELLEDAGAVARRHPGVMIGGMFLAGVALSRLIRIATAAEPGEERDAGVTRRRRRAGARRR